MHAYIKQWDEVRAREGAGEDLVRALLPDKISGHSQRVLVHFYDLLRQQNVEGRWLELPQIGGHHQRRLQERPQCEMRPLLLQR